MLDNKGFDLWAEEYDQNVVESDDENTYPFAGYKVVLNEIYKQVLESSAKDILDIGFGTGTLTNRLYEHGYRIYGQDFSEEMIKIAQKKMPEAFLYSGDFSRGLAEPLKNRHYDAIIATYSLHHLTDDEKTPFIQSLLGLLEQGGTLYIGDVAFQTRKDLEACKAEAIDYWDDEEFYFVFEEMKNKLPNLNFQKCSFCSGVLTISI